MEGSADQRGRRKVAAPVRHAGTRRAKWKVRRELEPGEGALEYGHATPGYDINEIIDKYMAELRNMLKDLRRAELIAAKEHDRVRAAARDVASAQAQSTSGTQGRRTSGADQLRHKGVEIVAAGKYEQEADEMSDTEVAMENDAQQADIALRAGLETTHQVQEHTTDAIPLYTAGEGTPGEMRRPKRWTPRSRRLRPKKQQRRRPTRRGGGYTRHIAKRGRSSTSGDKPSGTRRSATGGSRKGGGLLTKAIMQVQTRAADRRRDARGRIGGGFL
jgi:hypothetical protein